MVRRRARLLDAARASRRDRWKVTLSSFSSCSPSSHSCCCPRARRPAHSLTSTHVRGSVSRTRSGQLSLALVTRKPVDLLLDVRQLCVAKAGQEIERPRPLIRSGISTALRLLKDRKTVEDVAPLFGRSGYRRNRRPREHHGLPPVTRAADEERLVLEPQFIRSFPPLSLLYASLSLRGRGEWDGQMSARRCSHRRCYHGRPSNRRVMRPSAPGSVLTG